MQSLPTPDEVASDLGDKVMAGLSAIVHAAMQDLENLRDTQPSFVSRLSSRGLANVIHDMMRSHARTVFDEISGVTLTDKDQYFQIQTTAPDGTIYRIRVKRHRAAGGISAYPTQAALDFHSQPNDLLSILGIGTVHLCSGYEWDYNTKTIVGPVLSLRDGLHGDVVWMIDLPKPADGGSGTVTPIVPPKDGPSLPAIKITQGDASSNIEGTATP